MRRIGFIVSEFPRPVDAYLLRELLALVEAGLDVRIYSLRHPSGAAAPRAAGALLGHTTYPPRLVARGMRAAHASWLRTAPRRYREALAAAVRGHAASPRLLTKVLAVWPQTIYFAEQAQRDGIEHLHANWATYPAAAAAAISHLTGLPWSFGGHASDIYIDATNLPAKLRSAHFVTTCTEESRRYLLGLVPDVDPARVHTVYHGIDLSRPAPERAELPGLTILAVGTLRDCKGFDTLLRAAARVRTQGTPVRLIIVGDGEERPRLERLARRLGIAGRVAFTGYVPHEELARFYSVATLLVHPARRANHFGIPNVILEAAAARLPVVCSPLPALSELLEDGKNGVYVPEANVEGLAATLTALAADPARRRRLAEEGFRRLSEQFDITRTAVRFAELFLGGAAPSAAREAIG